MCASCALDEGEVMCLCSLPVVVDESKPDQMVCACDLTNPARMTCGVCGHNPA